jgi:thioredoxin 1
MTEPLARDFKVCNVNVDSNPQLAARYRIEWVPPPVVFKDAREVARPARVTSEAVLRRELEQLTGPAVRW